ncbi:mitochondrial import inner membrane translocase subunit Tim9-like [Mustela nigripes]|uniref:Mitochondrial import inner membrane translocase subunit n=2 Tax=Mustela putorius furo TaxID=9669 RepID=A0A8U0RTW4_MUSPF|nr:mitochondrial import inner membrane translocase subunit Tim9-like [Mustela putorius furo]XP_059227305.1 mitochondrial import inner membrane translocase subunit Tim9-like [Mustela nigripes]
MAKQIPESDQIKQFKEFLGTYNKLTETCFLDCVKDFTTREVKPEETTCSEHCLQKYLKMTQRISMRFQEYHIQQNEALAAKAGLLGQPRYRSPDGWTFDERLAAAVAMEVRIHLDRIPGKQQPPY